MKLWFGLLFLLPLGVQSAQLSMKVQAQKAILINVDTGQILFEKEAYEPAFPASVTKIATAIYAYSLASSLDEKIVAKRSSLKYMKESQKVALNYQVEPYLLEPDGVHFWMRPNEEMLFYDLMCGMMIASGNDAANVIAQHFGEGSIESFMEGVNHYLKEIGCTSTHFVNPHGLHHPDHYTTAYDLAQMARQASFIPEIVKISSTMNYHRPKTNLQSSKETYQKNRLISRSPFHYDKALGLKIGYTEHAKGTFVALARDENRTLALVLLGCPNRDARYKDAIAIFETAFDEKQVERLLFNKDDTFFSLVVKGAKQKLGAHLIEDIRVVYFPLEEKELEASVHFDDVALPIEKDSHVGYLHICEKGTDLVVIKSPLYASFRVESTLFFKVKRVLSGPGVWIALAGVVIMIVNLRRSKRYR